MNLNLLIQYQSIQKEMTELTERINRIYSDALFPKGTQITGMPRASGYSNDGMIRIFERIEELTEFYQEKQAALAALCMEIEAEIESLPSLERRIVRLRYLDGKHWSEISVATGYSVSHLHKIHARIFKDDTSRYMLS